MRVAFMVRERLSLAQGLQPGRPDAAFRHGRNGQDPRRMDAATPPPGYTPIAPPSNYVATMGPYYEKATADGGTRYALFVTEKHLNTIGIAHGGVTMGFLDTVFGRTARAASGGGRGATVQFSANFLTPAAADHWIEGEAHVTRRTRSLIFLHGRIWMGRRTLMTASGVFAWRRPETPA
jgi:uncharacterized protein (TIGR00369 family)